MTSSKRNRVHDSGYQKRKVRKRRDKLIASQKGAMDKFVVRESQTQGRSDNKAMQQE
jgi:hypothetical protein